MTPAKVVLIGSGSYAWAPQFIRDLITTPELQGSVIALHDIDPAPLERMHTLAQKLIASQGSDCRLEKTTALDEALPGADVVILTITTGGLEAMRADIEIPEKYGIYQSVGDTVGPGGLARALRNIPVVVEIARAMARCCPDAWLLNYTNPMTTLCRAVTRETAVRTVGLCHEFLGMRQTLQQMFDASPDEIEARVAGINHLIWILELKVRGQDAFPKLRELLSPAAGLRHGSAPGGDFPSLADHQRVKSRLFELFGALPAAGDRHVAEFFPFFLSEASGRARATR
jgi:alpha-galactosidase